MRSRWIAFACLSTWLTLPAILPEAANVAFLVLGTAALVIVLLRRKQRASLSLGVAAPLVAALLLSLASLMATQSIAELLGVGYFAPLYLVWPMAVIALTFGDDVAPSSISVWASIGGAIGLTVAVFDKVIRGLSGPGGSVSNPIHYADLLVILAVLSLAGLYDRRAVVRFVSVGGAACALAAVWMTGSRGALLAVPFVALTALTVVVWQGVQGAGRPYLALLPSVGAVVATVVAWEAGALDRIDVYSDAMSFFQSGQAADFSTFERLVMYEAAYLAWVASPIFGHGLFNVVSAAAGLSRGGVEIQSYDHLHSDLANFAVGAGVLGLLAYTCLIVAPLVMAGRRGTMQRHRAGQFIAATCAVGYLVMGATNAMFGVLSLTVLYAVVTILVAHLTRVEAAPSSS
jgi:O-antigen ligase